MRRAIAKTRRTALRHTMTLRCQIVRERDFVLVADRMLDLSESGLLTGPADSVLTGDRLIVSFQLPEGGYWIDTEATVARVLHGRRPGEGLRALGVSFDRLPGFAELVLAEALRTTPAVPPRTRFGRRRTRKVVAGLLRSRGE